MSAALGVGDVVQVLLERISSGAYAVGTQLPSCRALAAEFGTNPSTVDRALRRLADVGLVRTQARQGAYVTATQGRTSGDVRQAIAIDVARIVARARAAGLSLDAVRDLVDQALAVAGGRPRVAFVECNKTDLEIMATRLENATGVELDRVLLDEAAADLDDHYDVIATPLFHVADLVHVVRGLDRVIEINFVADAARLRELATLDPQTRVAVASPTQRGLQRMRSLVQQYYPGPVRTILASEADAGALAEIDVLVRPHAVLLPPEALAAVKQEICIEWELDEASARTFRARVDAALHAAGHQTPRPSAAQDRRHRARPDA